MMATHASATGMKLPYRILVLDDDDNALSGIVEMLRDAGHQVTGASTYDAAKRLLATTTYDLFITDVRLRGFNGLNLVRQSSLEYPDMCIAIMTGYDEAMMELEAGRYGAAFIRKPISANDLLATVERCLAAVRRQRRWARKRVFGGFRVFANGRPAAVVDVSYGGLRLEMPAGEAVPESIDVVVSGIGLHLPVDVVWKTRTADGITQCGAALVDDVTPAARTWRAIVDRLSA
jgi:DNA-binding response OmpR family regulator